MAIARKSRITPQDIEEVIACGYPLSQIAREAGVDRISLSKFRNHGQALKATDQTALFVWLQSNELWEEGCAAQSLPARAAPDTPLIQAFPLPVISVPVSGSVSQADRDAATRELDMVVVQVNRLMAEAVTYGGKLIMCHAEMSSDSRRLHDDLRCALVKEAILRRVLDGSFTARYQECQVATHADLLAQKYLRAIPGINTGADPYGESDLIENDDGVAQGQTYGQAVGEAA